MLARRGGGPIGGLDTGKERGWSYRGIGYWEGERVTL